MGKKKIIYTSLAILSLIFLTACDDQTKVSIDDATKTATSDMSNQLSAGETQKYPLNYMDSQTSISKNDSITWLIISYQDGDTQKVLKLPTTSTASSDAYALQSSSPVSTYNENILEDPTIDPYVEIKKDSDGKIILNVYRQPYQVYNQQPIEGVVQDKKEITPESSK
ncbi:hypothetical protein BG262_05750 [Floricoccus penangensis]|uniref:DUF5067 domain-containing protein n=1 Tax=Floricoccus penangensis TaxID=1859475 RepID=A0A9Q5JFI3_9LACT|nr:hypothetical protein [Floricoccus penangensis]OFI45987.1 hypothetical protein BG262_05750 [Floricoccus penangensis]